MPPIRLKIVTDETARPVAVQIDYQDWLQIQRLLGLPPASETGTAAADRSCQGPNGHYPLRNSVLRYDDPFEPAVSDTDWEALR